MKALNCIYHTSKTLWNDDISTSFHDKIQEYRDLGISNMQYSPYTST